MDMADPHARIDRLLGGLKRFCRALTCHEDPIFCWMPFKVGMQSCVGKPTLRKAFLAFLQAVEDGAPLELDALLRFDA